MSTCPRCCRLGNARPRMWTGWRAFRSAFARGTATTVKFSTQAAKLEDLFDLQALRVAGAVSNVDLAFPVLYNVKIYQVSAVGSLEQGVVRAQQVQARLGKTTARDGSFMMDLNAEALPMHVDVTATVDLAEGLGLAKRVLPDKQIQQQLNQVKRLEGSAVAHVTVSGNLSNLVPRVEVTALDVSARHAMVPFPIRVTRGALTYTSEALSVQGMNGAIGQSSFKEISARLGPIHPTHSARSEDRCCSRSKSCSAGRPPSQTSRNSSKTSSPSPAAWPCRSHSWTCR